MLASALTSVQHQVVDAQDALAGKEQLADLTDLFRVRLAAQQAVHGIAADLKARLEHHGRHHQADPAVNGPVKGQIGQHAEQHRAGGEHVAQAILGGGQQRAVVDGGAQPAVEKEQPQLEQHRRHQNRHDHP